jgi:hypothetical protein
MIKLVCKTCGKAFYRYPKAIGNFCSRACYYESRKQELDSPRKCRRCGETKNIEAFTERKERQGQRTYICDTCRNDIQQQIRYMHGKQRPMEESPSCSAFLGVAVAEVALSRFFDNIKRAPYSNPGFDFICGKGFKIDVKSSCERVVSRKYSRWVFSIRHNRVADYFLCLAFDDRELLTPKHVWLIPGSSVSDREMLSISCNPSIVQNGLNMKDRWTEFSFRVTKSNKLLEVFHERRQTARFRLPSHQGTRQSLYRTIGGKPITHRRVAG